MPLVVLAGSNFSELASPYRYGALADGRVTQHPRASVYNYNPIGERHLDQDQGGVEHVVNQVLELRCIILNGSKHRSRRRTYSTSTSGTSDVRQCSRIRSWKTPPAAPLAYHLVLADELVVCAQRAVPPTVACHLKRGERISPGWRHVDRPCGSNNAAGADRQHAGFVVNYVAAGTKMPRPCSLP